MSDTLILFYHDQSPACIKLKELLTKNPPEKTIKYVNISSIQEIPKAIISIPALIVNDKDLILGKKVFDYFQKSDDMEYIQFSSKNSGIISSFSSLEDDNVESGSMFSTLDAPCISKGVPEYNEENESKLDLDKFTSERASQIPIIKKE